MIYYLGIKRFCDFSSLAKHAIPAVLFCCALLIVGTAEGHEQELQASLDAAAYDGSWRITAPEFSEEVVTSGSDQRDMLRISGAGGLSKIVALNGKTNLHLLDVDGFSRPVSSESAAGWTGFGVTYYDASWNRMKTEQARLTTVAVDEILITNRQTVWAKIPADAAFAMVWIWNTNANTETFVAEAELFNYFPTGVVDYDPTQPGGDQFCLIDSIRANLVVNGDFGTYAPVSQHRKTGNEFWFVNKPEFEPGFYPFDDDYVVGAVTGETFIYQQVEIEPTQRYRLEVDSYRKIMDRYTGQAVPRAGAGIDFYDENFNKLRQRIVPLNTPIARNTPPAGIRIKSGEVKAPYNASYAFVWIWAAPDDSGAQLPLLVNNISLKPVFEDRTPPTVEIESAPADMIYSGDTTVPVFIRVADETAIDPAIGSGLDLMTVMTYTDANGLPAEVQKWMRFVGSTQLDDTTMILEYELDITVDPAAQSDFLYTVSNLNQLNDAAGNVADPGPIHSFMVLVE